MGEPCGEWRLFPARLSRSCLMSIDARNLLLCVLVPLAAILVAWPFAEGGYIDDFSYIHMAKTLSLIHI